MSHIEFRDLGCGLKTCVYLTVYEMKDYLTWNLPFGDVIFAFFCINEFAQLKNFSLTLSKYLFGDTGVFIPKSFLNTVITV